MSQMYSTLYTVSKVTHMYITSEYAARIRRFAAVTVSKPHMKRSLSRLHNTSHCALGRRALGVDVCLGHWLGDEFEHWVTALIFVEQILKLFRFASTHNFCLVVMQ